MTQLWRFSFLMLCSLNIVVGIHAQIIKLPYADTTSGNYFGTSVALDGKWAIVGASGETSCDVGGGAAYVYQLTDSTRSWNEVARLAPQHCEAGFAFGRKVALHGRTALVTASQEFFGQQNPNPIFVYELNDDGSWLEATRISNSSGNDQRLSNVATDIDIFQDRLLYTTGGDPTPDNEQDGAVYVYNQTNGIWSLGHRLVGSGTINRGIFGGSSTLYQDIIAVASSSYFSRRSGSVYIFELGQDRSWSEVAQLRGIQGFFISLDLYRDELIIGQPEAGSRESGQATLFRRDSLGAWLQTATLEPPTPYRKGAFGTEVALYEDRALIVGYDEQLRLNFNVDRVVYIYARREGQWHYQGILDIGEASFGSSIDLYGKTALIGSASGSDVGKAFIITIP
ncbi:MAG: FG-GAP repeat protein [Bacteroidetes bacterium]|nr:FG-GAP repeat protein [Bacteroidota bacterium]MCY4225549.1 FG-GAP repeat protein [Bacteroidota bacterium]